MFDHVTIRVSDREASERFYATVLGAAGIEPTSRGGEFLEWRDFSIAAATGARPVTRRLHIGFAVPSRAHVDAFWQAGVDAGHPDDGAPGERPQYTASYYGGFLLDPDGNSAEAVHHDGVRTDGVVDHLWLRTRDLGAVRRFYRTIAPATGLRPGTDSLERISFNRAGAGGGTFSFVPGEPTEHVHLAFPAAGEAAVAAFHRAATDAGFADEGAPGERPHYHPGYIAAFVRDPDGHVVESVLHRHA